MHKSFQNQTQTCDYLCKLTNFIPVYDRKNIPLHDKKIIFNLQCQLTNEPKYNQIQLETIEQISDTLGWFEPVLLLYFNGV